MVKIDDDISPGGSHVPGTIESPAAKLVWVWLAANGPKTPQQIAHAVDESLSQTLSILAQLRRQGVVESRDDSTVVVSQTAD